MLQEKICTTYEVAYWIESNVYVNADFSAEMRRMDPDPPIGISVFAQENDDQSVSEEYWGLNHLYLQ